MHATAQQWTIYFPATSGLRSRRADQYDRYCLSLWRAIQSGNTTRAEMIERDLREYCGVPKSDMDEAYSHGQTMSRCEFRLSPR